MKTAGQALKVVTLTRGDEYYPPLLQRSATRAGSPVLYVLGSPGLLLDHALGLICSRRCPGSVLVRMYDLMQALKLQERTVIGGFHSPMERECLELLSRGRGKVVYCPARGLQRMRFSPLIRSMIGSNRMVIVSPFELGVRRSSLALAQTRNRFVGWLSAEVLIAYAAPGSATEQLALELLSLSKPVFTIDDPSNRKLLQLGAQVYQLSTRSWQSSRPE